MFTRKYRPVPSRNPGVLQAALEERCSLDDLSDLDWTALRAQHWSQCQDAKQAEFLIERSLPWELVSRIGVCAPSIHDQAVSALQNADHRPSVEIKHEWYYST